MGVELRTSCVVRQRIKRDQAIARLICRLPERRKVDPIVAADRVRALMPGSTFPGRAVAYGADGYPRVTKKIVTPGAYTILDIIQTPGGTTCTAILNVAPPSSLDGLTGKIRTDGGINGTTTMAHEADGSWALKAGVDGYTYELLGTTFDPTSIFGGGRLHVGVDVDASVELNKLYAWAASNAPSEIRYPIGALGIINQQLVWPSNCKMYGGGGKNTFFYLADVQNQPGYPAYIADPVNNKNAIFYHAVVSAPEPQVADEKGNLHEFYFEGFTVYGNRVHQLYATGMHCVRLGDDLSPQHRITVKARDFHVLGSAGYGMQLGSYSIKENCVFDQCSFMWSDSDNFDNKNRNRLNKNNRWLNCNWGFHALGDQGTNLKLPMPIPNNGITTYVGLTTITISRNSTDKATRAGERVTIANAVPFDGVNPNGSWPVMAVSSGANTITIDIGQLPTVGGISGGGAAATMCVPHISVGDCLLDMRGENFQIVGGYCETMFNSRNGFRQRNDEVHTPNPVFRDLRIKDRTFPWVKDTDSDGRGAITVLGFGASVSGIRADLTATINGLWTGAGQDGAIFTDVKISGGQIGAICRGNNNKFIACEFKNPSQKGVEVYGAVISVTIDLGQDPMTPVALNSPAVRVVFPDGQPHGKSVGQSIWWAGTANGPNGLTVLGSNTQTYTVTSVIDPYTLTFNASGNATNTEPFGGGSITAILGSTDNVARNNTFIGCRVIQTTANGAKAWSIGKSDGAADGHAANTRIIACEDWGSSKHCEDEGDRTDFAGFNKTFDLNGNPVAYADGALPNNGSFSVISADSLAAGYQLVGGGNIATGIWDQTIDGPSTSIEFHTIGLMRDVKMVALGLAHGGAGTQNWQAQVSQDNAVWKSANGDYARSGAAAGTSGLVFCGSVAAATPASGVIEFDMFNMNQKHAVRINGGADNSATGAQSQMGYVTAAAALQAARIIGGSGFATTAGIVFCLGKVAT